MDNYSGWEGYYNSSDAKSIWKDEVEPFLNENMDVLVSGQSGLKILDIACGDGRNTAFFCRDGNAICCVDISETALIKLGNRFPDTVRLCENFTKTSLVDNQFDLTLCFDGLAQMEEPEFALEKMIKLTKSSGLIVFNFFTPNDCAYGEGDKIDDLTFSFKNTLFKFYTYEQAEAMIPDGVDIVKKELRLWNDPPHGGFRPYPHKHEASFFILRKV